MTWCSRGVSPDHVESQIYESARMLDLRCHQNSPKSIKSEGTSLGFDCDMESNKTCPPNAPVPHDDGLSAFLSVRPRLFGIAYRMLHSPAEAEDVVQDVWVRWQTTDRRIVRDAAAFLVTSATRLAINVLQSARSRRETHVSPWLPEPIDAKSDPGQKAEERQALEFGVRLLLEKLSPAERAAYILREAFDYAYRDIADLLRIEEANARQVVTRARQHIANGHTRESATTRSRLLDSLTAAVQRGDVAGLERVLASEVVSASARTAAA
jgi:RNA polymerase sigma-70 factor, ECF subfamily